MNENQHDKKKLSTKEQAASAGKDIAEIGAKTAGKHYGGPVGGAAADKALNTKSGQKAIGTVGNKMAKNPIARRGLAKMSPMISQNKNAINSTVDNSISDSTSNSSAASNNSETVEENSSSSIDNSDNEETTKKTGSDDEITGKIKGLFNKKNIKIKLALIGIISSLLFTMIFIVVLISPLIALGIIDIDGTSGSGSLTSYVGFSDTNSNTGYWWPVGGSDISTNNGKSFAIGEPTCTYISSNFGLRELDNASNNHSGIDIACSPSNYHNVIAALDGTVIEVVDGYSEGRNQSAGYGNHVRIQHNNGNVTIYGHMYINSITVAVGDQVKQGQVIGKMGNSGNSTGTHLHFEIRTNGSAVDPTNFISSDNARPSSSTGNFVSGESNQQTVCLSLKANGFSENGTVALLTNISHESSFDPTAVGDNGTSFGICQWHDSRYTNLQNSFPNNYQTIDSQIQFLIYELKNSYPSLYEDLINGNGDGNELTNKFCSQFEKPYDTENTCRNRGNNASSYDKYVKKGCQ